jgi:hypothetical protein
MRLASLNARHVPYRSFNSVSTGFLVWTFFVFSWLPYNLIGGVRHVPTPAGVIITLAAVAASVRSCCCPAVSRTGWGGRPPSACWRPWRCWVLPAPGEGFGGGGGEGESSRLNPASGLCPFFLGTEPGNCVQTCS